MIIGVVEERMIGLLRRKNPLYRKIVGTDACEQHQGGYVRLASDTHLTHELVLDTSLRAPEIRASAERRCDGTYRRFRARELGEWTRVSECRKECLAKDRKRKIR